MRDCRISARSCPAFLDGFARIKAVPQRILVAAWSARSQRTTMHSAALSSAHRGDLQGLSDRVLVRIRWSERITPCSSRDNSLQSNQKKGPGFNQLCKRYTVGDVEVLSYDGR